MPPPERAAARPPFVIGNHAIPAGTVGIAELFAARLPSGSDLAIPIRVVHGSRDGPCVFISAGLHGDELNGIEIARRLLTELEPRRVAGTVIVAPLVNVFGFLNRSRYLPDGRDLNRAFPGSKSGPLASRLAHVFVRDVVGRSSVGIDLHTATRHRSNLPQIRTDLDHDLGRGCAEAFGAHCALHSEGRDGSLRAAAARQGKPVLVYEAGEAQRFDADAIRIGMRGCRQVLAHLGMLRQRTQPRRTPELLRQSAWIRAPRGGLARLTIQLGDQVGRGDQIGTIGDAFADDETPIRANLGGRVIGLAFDPAVHQGDALAHLAQ